MRPRRRIAQHAQAFKVCSQDRVLDPQEIVPGAPDGLELDHRLLRTPCFIGVDHYQRALANMPLQQFDAMQVALEVGMPDLDLEGGIAKRIRMSKQPCEFMVVEVIVQPAGVCFYAVTRAAEELPQRQAGLLCGKVPQRDLNGFAERQRRCTLVSAARARDLMSQACRVPAFETGPYLREKDALDLGKRWHRKEQRLHEAEPDIAGIGDQFDSNNVHIVSANLAVADHTIASELETSQSVIYKTHRLILARPESNISELPLNISINETSQVTEATKIARNRAAPAPDGKLLSDVAYDRILEGLFDKTVPAGAFVSQNDLVQLLNIPVAPLRDALRILEHEGVVTIHPRSGIQFIKPDLELTRSTYQYRAILERAAVRVFAEAAEEDDVREILDQHQKLLKLIEADGYTPEAQAGLDSAEAVFHGAVIDILQNPLVTSNYKRMRNYLRLLRVDRKITPSIALRTVREHIAVLEACIAHDPDRAEAALLAHFQAALQRSLGMF